MGSVNSGFLTNEKLQLQLHELRADIDRDLALRRFAFVPAARAEMHDKLTTNWGEIWKAFPRSEKDVRGAVDCYLLDLHTASVFHSMRIAEFGIRKLAKSLKVQISDSGQKMPIELGTWDKVLTAIHNKIRAVKPSAKSYGRERQLEYYSEAADHCLYMKDIWRNPVSHTRKPHIEADAARALSRVRDFMYFLARGVRMKP